MWLGAGACEPNVEPVDTGDDALAVVCCIDTCVDGMVCTVYTDVVAGFVL